MVAASTASALEPEETLDQNREKFDEFLDAMDGEESEIDQLRFDPSIENLDE